MSVKRMSLVILVASVVVLAVGVGPRIADTVQALPPAQEASSSDVTISYPGRLAGDDGQAVADGAYDFTFALYSAQAGGEPLWSEVQEGVPVKGGSFAAALGSANPIPQGALATETLWLAVGVRGPGEADFTALTPRQSLSTAAPAAPSGPTAGAACPHDHWAETWNGSGIGLHLVSSNDTPLWAVTSGGFAGVDARNTTGMGVKGISTSSDGVAGESAGAGKSGVYGYNSANGYGVFGRSVGRFGLGAAGAGDGSGTDLIGDLELGGSRGEIFAFGAYLNMYSNGNINLDLDNDNNSTNQLRVYNGAEGEVLLLDEAGNLTIPGTLFKGGLAFRIDHPLDPENRYLNHSGVESPDMMNIYNGNVTLDANGEAWVELPEWFETLNGGPEHRSDFRYQLTCIGGFAPVYIAQEIQGNRFQIAGGTPELKVSWQVTGIRHDPYAEAHRIPVEEDKSPEAQGTYLHPLEYGKPETLAPDTQQDQR